MSEQFLFLAEGAVLRDEDNSDTGWRVHGNNGPGVNLSNTMFFKNDVLDTETYPELDYGPSNWIDWDTTVLDENTDLVTTYGIKDGYEEIFNTVSSAVELSNKNVALDKIYRDGGKYKPMTISGEAFLSRFLLHVLPKGFVRIRYYGILSCRCKREKITLCRNLLGCQKYLSQLRDKTVAEKLMILYKHDISKCSKCSGKMITYRVPGRYMLC